jgi:hypothetical protein
MVAQSRISDCRTLQNSNPIATTRPNKARRLTDQVSRSGNVLTGGDFNHDLSVNERIWRIDHELKLHAFFRVSASGFPNASRFSNGLAGFAPFCIKTVASRRHGNDQRGHRAGDTGPVVFLS